MSHPWHRRSLKLAPWIMVAVGISIATFITSAQSRPDPQRPREQKPVDVKPAEPPPDVSPNGQEIDTIKVDTNLVTVPVIASSRSGNYIADLRKEEFRVSEDGVAQDIAFFATVSAPFHVVLMLDTSDSTREKLGQIQRAAIEFVDQLSAADKVKIISFDNEVRDWNEFTGDKAILRGAIGQTRTGKGTRVYDAVQRALNALRPIQQRKAIVIFTDGADWHSDDSTFEGTIRDLDESGVIVYPIRFDTRADTERLARQEEAEQNGRQLPTTDVIRRGRTTTPTTFPSDEPSHIPERQPTRNPLPILNPEVIFGRRRNPPNDPTSGNPVPDPTSRPPTIPTNSLPDGGRKNDTLSAMLDQMYLMADSYLGQLADRSGGQVYRADNVGLLPQAFAAIAAELRTQYLLGYYPANRELDGRYRKIQVKTTRKDLSIRSRPGYRTRSSQ